MLGGAERGGYIRSRRGGGARGGSEGSPGPSGLAGSGCQDGAETSPAPGAPWELPALPGGARGCQAGGTRCVPLCRYPVLHPHAVPSILVWSGPGSPSSCSSQALPAGSPAVSRAAVCQALCTHPQGSWSQRFSQNARDTVLVQWWSGWGEGCCGVLRCSSCPGNAHPCRLVPPCRRAPARARENPANPAFPVV